MIKNNSTIKSNDIRRYLPIQKLKEEKENDQIIDSLAKKMVLYRWLVKVCNTHKIVYFLFLVNQNLLLVAK